MLTLLANRNLLGWDVTGDIGGFTTYDSKRRKVVVFERSPPLNPPTPTQEANRDRFRDVATWWQTCPQQYCDQVQRVATQAGLRCTGYNLATFCAFERDLKIWETACNQAREFPQPPPYLGTA